jgi:hypothetical protein
LREFISVKLETHTIDEVRLLTLDRFNIKQARFHYIWSKMNWQIRFREATATLTNFGYLMREYQGAERDIPELFLAMSPTMRELYNIYGDTVAFDITYNLVKPRSTKKKQWGLRVLSGIGKNINCNICFLPNLLINKRKYEKAVPKLFRDCR